MVAKIREHPTHFALGVGLIMIGVWLILNDKFFLWPPYAVDVANDDIWGGIFAAIGVGLIVWVFDRVQSARWNAFLLTSASGLMSFLTAYEFLIWVATGHYQSWVSNLIITAFVLISARRSSTRDEK